MADEDEIPEPPGRELAFPHQMERRLRESRQARLAHAQAILRKTAILLLDGVTSALGNNLQAVVRRSFGSLACTRIAVMEHGRVVEGPCKVLAGAGGRRAALVRVRI